MAFWCRFKQSNLKPLLNQLKRYYIQVPSLNRSATQTGICAAEKPIWGTVKKPTDFCNNVRFFASPVQAQSKEEKENDGTRLNDQIKAQYVRLVMEEGHKVVPRHEALALARELELDLVEVQRNANPPVCKIMDFHREKYKKEVLEKERAKAKSDVTLKKGDCKEVRFSGKIEQKDLKMKADTVKRLIEKGYRVKCMALPVGKKEEGEDLGGYLSRFTALIEDIAIVESGPHVEKKQAYVVVRHVKFGPSKKGGGRKSKVVGDTSGVSKNGTPPSNDHLGDIRRPALVEGDPAEFGSEIGEDTVDDGVNLPESPSMEMRDKKIGTNKTAWSVSDSSGYFNDVFDIRDDTRGATPNFTATEINAPETAQRSANLNAANLSGPKPGFVFSRADTLPTAPPERSLGTENRYKRSEPRNQFLQKSIDNRGTGVRDSFRSEPQFPGPRRQPPPSSIPRQEPQSGIPNAQRSSYGNFSNPTANATAGQGVAPNVHRNREGSPSNSVRHPGAAGVGANQNIPGLKSDSNQRPSLSNDGQGKFGIFSR